jgi:hypothetical protein
MIMARTIDSPGVEIRERDLSLNASLPVGTNILVHGYATQGPTDELLNVTSVTEWEQIYGSPENAAERYFYHACRQVINSPGNLVCTRMPYGSGDGTGTSDYSALLYPISGFGDTAVAASTANSFTSQTYSDDVTVVGYSYQDTITPVASISAQTLSFTASSRTLLPQTFNGTGTNLQ